MNDKIRSILHTAWSEPRHFFFWLAMLCICGFAAAASGAALVGATLPLAFVAMGCILCFVVSVPAFILAWIPPVRRLFSWLLRRRFLVLGCAVTLFALFYAIEDWRGREAWQTYKRAWEAKGERFELAGLVPPPLPNDQNFFATPLWDDLRFAETNRGSFWSQDDQEEHRVVFNMYGPNGKNAPSTGNPIKAQRVDLAAWQAYYRGSDNLFAAQSGPPTNYFPIAKQPQTPAADILLALSKFNENRQLLIAAAARPQARFWINYDAGFALMIPHLSRMKATSQYLCLHANAALKVGDRETAMEDVKLSLRLIEAIRGEPIVISHLVRIAQAQIALQPVWEGLADRRWTDAELSVIDSELGKLDFLADYQFAMRGERACNIWGVDYFRKVGITGLDEMVAPSKASGPVEMEQFLGRAAFWLIPTGWFDQNKLSLCRMHEKYLLPLVGNQDRRVISPAAIQQANAALDGRGVRPYDMFSRMLLPALGGIAEKCARGQTSVDLARIACALERCRLANGQFPETLEALAPKFIEKLPHDIITGQPLKYRRTDDGQFVLYSVGWNETDDGGTLGLTKNGNVDWHKGDWIWRYPAQGDEALPRSK
jgi:hypothetical protein